MGFSENKMARKMELSHRISKSRNIADAFSMELGQKSRHAETWTEDDIRQVKRLNTLIDREEDLQERLYQEMTRLDRESA